MPIDHKSLSENACIRGVLDALETAIPTTDQKQLLDGLGHLAEEEKRTGKAKDDNEALGNVLERAIENGKQRKSIEVANRLRDAVIVNKKMGEFKTHFSPETADEFLQAQLSGKISRKPGYRSKSTSHLQKIAEGEAIGKLYYNLKKEGVLESFRSKENESDLASELFEEGSTKNEVARKQAKIIKGIYGELISRLRRAGIPVGSLDEFITSFHRNPARMMNPFDSVGEWFQYRLKNGFNHEKEMEMAYQKWKAFELQHLNWDKTFKYGQTKQKIENFMRHAWTSQTVFDAIKRNDSIDDLRTFGSLGVSGARKRAMFYKSGPSFKAVNDRYGHGNIYDSIENTIRNSSKLGVMAEEWGASPYRTFGHLVNRLKRYNVVKTNQALKGRINDNYRIFDELTGRASIPVNKTLNDITNAYLGWQVISKLGGSIAPAFGDLNYYVANLVRNFDMSYPSAWGSALKNYFGHMRRGATKENYEDMGYWQKPLLGSHVSRFGALDSPTQLITSATQKMMSLNLIHWQDSMLSSGIISETGHQLFRYRTQSFDNLTNGTKKLFQSYDISSEEWDVMRKNPSVKDNRGYITPDDAINNYSRQDIADMLGKNIRKMTDKEYDDARTGIRQKYIGLLNDQSHFVYLDSDIYERSKLRLYTKSGTPMGTLAKLLVMFRSWPYAQTRRVLGMALEDVREAKGWRPKTKALLHGAPQLMSMIAGYMITGYISEAAVNLAQGKEPPSLSDPVTWAKSSLGALGLAGSMVGQLVGQQMYGSSPIANIGGAGIDTANKLGIIVNAMSQGRGHTVGKMLYNMGKSQVPYHNLIYTRAMVNWGILYGLEEKLFPGSLNSLQRNAKKDGIPFLVSPDKALFTD
ncbi:MAG: hypothetical protein ACTSP4_00500 [Candidatus Hodarchaeales archaeon]